MNTIYQHRLVTFLFLVFVASFSCSSASTESAEENASDSWVVTVRGKVTSRQSGQIVIQEVKDGGQFGWQDTIQLASDDTFKKKITLRQPGYYKINFFNRQFVDIVLYKNDLEVNVDGNQNGFKEVKGSPEIAFIQKVYKVMEELEGSPELARMNEEFVAANQKGDEKRMMELQQQYQNMMKEKQLKVAEMLKNETPSLAVINLLQNNVLDKDVFFDTYVAIADKFKKEWPDYEHSKNFVQLVERMKALAIGKLAPEISLPDPDGKVVPLSSLRGQYVLVDFWAKWCGPCRQENPNIVRAFNKYKNKGFTVYGVSLDRTREDWVQAIQQDNLTWTHVSDLKFWQSEAARLYNITGIPFSLLLDPDGVIIAKNLRGAALDAKLAEIFKDK